MRLGRFICRQAFVASTLVASMGVALAQPPVIDMSPQEELRVLRQQMENFTRLDLPGKIDALQQQIQQLNGRLEVQTHQVEALVQQQKSFYQDLNQRLINLQAAGGSGGSNPKLSNGILQAQENVSRGTTVPEAGAPAAAPTTTTDAITTPTPAATEAEEKAYQDAFALLSKKQNSEAVSAFNAFLVAYPKGKRAPNVHYWLGELYSSQKNNTLAVKHLKLLVAEYPTNEKVPDAMLKLAIIEEEGGQKEKAQQAYKAIVQKYPNSSAARLANMRLQRR